jgi:exopolysaccharide biosynthesis WecB/TagA/CpsF family protein
MGFDVHSGPARVRITATNRPALMADLDARLAAGQGFALATLNLDHLVKLRADPAFAAAYAAQDIVTADGNPVVWLARLSGQQIDLIPGADLVVPTAGLAARRGVSVALFGSTADTLDAAAATLKAIHPELVIAARIAPPMGFDPTGPTARAMLEQVVASGAGLCFLALGAPRQERLAALARVVAPRVGFLSVGAALDFLGGEQSRAPLWVRRLALEWLWRLLSDPRRLGLRYLRSALILPGLMVRALRQRSGEARGSRGAAAP